MKGDERVQTVEERADSALLVQTVEERADSALLGDAWYLNRQIFCWL